MRNNIWGSNCFCLFVANFTRVCYRFFWNIDYFSSYEKNSSKKFSKTILQEKTKKEDFINGEFEDIDDDNDRKI